MHSALFIPALTCPVPLTCPFLPWLVLSLCPVQSCPGLSCPSHLSIPALACPVPLPCPVSAALSWPLLPCPVYFRLVLLISTVSCVSIVPALSRDLFWHVLSCLALPCPALQWQVGYTAFSYLFYIGIFVPACPIRSCPLKTCPDQSTSVLSCPFLSCPAHFCPVLSISILSCPFLSCPVHFCLVLSIYVLSCLLLAGLTCPFLFLSCPLLTLSANLWPRDQYRSPPELYGPVSIFPLPCLLHPCTLPPFLSKPPCTAIYKKNLTRWRPAAC